MKKLVLHLCFCSCFTCVFCQTQPTERQLIEQSIQLYFDGWATGDTSKLGAAMHESCHLKIFRDGNFTQFTRSQYLALFKPHPKSPQLLTRIVTIDVTNNVASAKIELSTDRALFTDYFNLMKTVMGWKIVDKVSTNAPHRTVDINLITPQKDTIISGLNRPWSIAFVSEEEVLVSEKDGQLLKVNLVTKTKTRIDGTPSDMINDQIGFGDNTGKFEVLLDPEFKQNRFIYLSYAAKKDTLRTTKIIRAVLDNHSLREIKTLFIAEPYTPERYHYGGGMVFGKDGKLYFTIGERLFSEKDEPVIPIAQNIQDRRGKIYRINPDGSIPKDNPDFGTKAVPGLYAIGIRAAQGLALDTISGKIWFSEHGTHQGDEINLLSPKANYGWPIKTSGKYRFTEYAPKPAEGVSYKEPEWAWLQTVAPTGLLVYHGKEFSAWNNNLLVGGLSRGSLWRIVVEGGSVKSIEELFTNDRVRIRKIVQSPAGNLYIITDEVNGKIIRIKNLSL